MSSTHNHHSKLTAAGMLVTLGIIFGDIGTSPLYVLKAIAGDREISEKLIYGGISCVFWTLTLQTTFKYILITLQADNKGEGGVFSLYALVRKYGKYLFIPAIVGAGTLLADGIITPPISVSSAIEGLRLEWPHIPVLPLVIGILTLLFFFQQFGTRVVGRTFGPIMVVWFTMIASLGTWQIMQHPGILGALNPAYAWDLLVHYPKGFWLLGAVFLATTGAEALYSDLGHCGRKNIRVSWIFVKVALILNYMGQGAWILQLKQATLGGLNPFYEIMPRWFLLPGILIATCATIIASQALISGSYTLINEAITLNFWPRVRVKYPGNVRGQIYIPSINWILWAGCIAVMLYFRESSNMEAAYGFSITIAMLMTTVLMAWYMRFIKKYPLWIVVGILLVFLLVESSFFIANIAKIRERWMFLVFEVGIIFTMLVWYRARKISSRYITYSPVADQAAIITAISEDEQIPKFASHLVYLTKSADPRAVEDKILYSILRKKPKRADVYWFLHIEQADEPYLQEYKVTQLVPGKIIRVDFRLGFREPRRVNLLLRQVITDLVAAGEVHLTSTYPSLQKEGIPGDFSFVVNRRFMSIENDAPFITQLVLQLYFLLKKLSITDEKAFGLDTSTVITEQTPLLIQAPKPTPLHRIS